ncbi:MAG: helix-turn-helix domain-containing protein [Lachnospiraceae bacterium]|nr:helix-turn-helix domain-containing protein [Lachnospiraceae bacterium]
MKNKTGSVIFAFRKMKGWTQEQLAEFVGVSSVAVSKWERGISVPEVELLCRLADLFETSVDELLGRSDKRMDENERYTKEQMEDFEVGKTLLEYCALSRQEGLLALEEAAGREGTEAFLSFAIGLLLDGMRMGFSHGQLFGWLANYAAKEKHPERCRMICEALQLIFAGENEVFLRELIASHLGKEFRSRLVKGVERKESREEILKKYIAVDATVDLLEELVDLDDRSVQLLLRNLDNVTLIRALAGASGKVCRRFLQNLSDRLLYFIDEDICAYHGSAEEMREAQKHILEMAAGMEFIKA